MKIYIFFLFLSFLTSTFFTYLFKKLSLKLNFLDIPTENRKIHCSPVPLLGGAAIIVSFYLMTFLGIYINPLFQKRLSWDFFLLFAGGIAVFLVGLLDDKYSFSPVWKLFLQMLSVGSVIYMLTKSVVISNPFSFFGGPKTIALSFPIAFLLNFLWVIFMINAFNFIDGIDGLASNIALVSSLSLFLISLTANKILIAYLFLVLTGILIGFARYNNYPAQIFLGDSGSMFLGYILSALSILAEGKTTATFSFLLPMLIFGIPIYDTLVVISIRASQGRSIFLPDTNHLHHRLLKHGFTPKQIVVFMYILSLILGITTFLLLLVKNEFAALVVLLLSFVGINMGEKYLTKKTKKSEKKREKQR